MYKNLLKIIIFACLVLAIIAGISYYIKSDKMPSVISNDTKTQSKESEQTVKSLKEDKLHGQISYDMHAALPAQAILNIKLTETDTSSGKIIAQLNKVVSGPSPIDWALPVSMDELDANKNYQLQAKISSGDTLLFVNGGTQAVDKEHSAYAMRLEKVDSAMTETDTLNDIKGQNWALKSFLGEDVPENAQIGLLIDKEAKIDPKSHSEVYRVGGSGGCNRYMGTAEIDKDKKSLHFSPLGTTFMACVPEVGERETKFIGMMSQVRFYQYDESGDLYLLDDNKKTLAHFIATK